MRPCPVCGTLTAETDDFCGNCGTYLGWGQPAAGQSTEDQPRPDQPQLDQPLPVQPATPIAPRPTRETAVAEAKVDGPPCPNCGTANRPGRRYCRRCAYPLTGHEEPAQSQRQRRFRRPRGGSGRLARTLVILALVVLLVIAGFALRPVGVWVFQDILDKTSHAAPVHPVAETASAATPGHPATAAADGITNRYWGSPGVGSWIEFTFDHPFRLLSLDISTGSSTDPTEFGKQARPTQFDIVATASDGTATNLSCALLDQPGAQTVQAGISDVVRIRLTIRAVAGSQPGKVAALGEVEFFQRS